MIVDPGGITLKTLNSMSALRRSVPLVLPARKVIAGAAAHIIRLRQDRVVFCGGERNGVGRSVSAAHQHTNQDPKNPFVKDGGTSSDFRRAADIRSPPFMTNLTGSIRDHLPLAYLPCHSCLLRTVVQGDPGFGHQRTYGQHSPADSSTTPVGS